MEDFYNAIEPLLLLLLLFALIFGPKVLIEVVADKIYERQGNKRRERERREREREEESDISKGLKKVKMVCSCGQEYPDGCKFCAVDGQALRRVVYDNSKLICPKCKKEFPTDAKYCPEHGELLIKVAK